MALKSISSPVFGYGIGFGGISAATGILKLLGDHINPTTAALVFLLLILLVATVWGSRPAVFASLVAVICFNFFFLPPFGTFTIGNPDNWVALVAFVLTALTAGQLSARAKQRAEDAETARREIERLYYELQDTFERSSQAKALKQSERLKTALLDAVTHDLRTPLTSIKASATTLLADLYRSKRDKVAPALDIEGRKEMLEVIDEETDRLDRFIEGLTKLARIDAGEMHLRTESCAIDEILDAALKRAEPRTRDHQVELWIEDELPAVKGDEPALAEAAYILMDNAAKYSPPGTTIRVSARPHDKAIVITVEDEGPGIRADMRERVFEKFFRATQDGDLGDRKSAGSGLGLAIAYGIIHAHGGRIWIEAAEGHAGAKFVIELPMGSEPPAVASETLR